MGKLDWLYCLLAVALLLGLIALKLEAQRIDLDDDKQSTTGPEPPKILVERDAEKAREAVPFTGTEVQLIVPGYLWRHGCGPTALGMVVGYYDTFGYSALIPGDASTQTSDVDQAIASGGYYSNPNPPGFEEHYEDYSRPQDYHPDLFTDDYITQGRTPHIDNCIADYMDTSKSTRSNRYGWSKNDDLGPSFISYVLQQSFDYSPSYQEYQMPSTLTWELLTSEIDNGRPMVFLADSDGDGVTDHFVTAVGYRGEPNQQQYGCLDTWPDIEEVRWENFQQGAAGRFWGISHGWSFRLVLPCDFDKDGTLDFDDLDVLVGYWLDRSYPEQGLVGYWRFEEGSGDTAHDSSGNGNDGTLNGDPNWVTGKIGTYALEFDGDGDYVEVPDSNTGLDIDSNITIAAWVKLDSTAAAATIVGKQPSGVAADNYPGNYIFMTVAGGKLRLSHQRSTDGDLSYYESNIAVGVGDWYHVAVTSVEGGNVNFYINGFPAGTSIQSVPFGILNDEPVRIGVKKNAVGWFNGIIDEVAIYNRALSTLEIRKYYLVDLNHDGEINFLDFTIFANNWR